MKKLFNRNLNKEIVIIAEVGLNHEGNFEKAKKICRELCKTDIDAIKLQSFTLDKYCSTNDKKRYAMLKKFSLNRNQHIQLAKIVKGNNKYFLSTPLTEDWVSFISDIGDAIKIASGDLTFKPVIERSAMQKKPVILSTGASSTSEIKKSIGWFKNMINKNTPISKKLALMHCVSNYPAENSECNLKSIPYLKNKFNLVTGWSNHSLNDDVNISAVSLGASIIELHVTDNKKAKTFRDHALSYEIKDLDTIIKRLREIKKALGILDKKPTKNEKKIYLKIRKGLVAKKDLMKGKKISEEDLSYARPSSDFSSNDLNKVVGKKINRDLVKGSVIVKKYLK